MDVLEQRYRIVAHAHMLSMGQMFEAYDLVRLRRVLIWRLPSLRKVRNEALIARHSLIDQLASPYALTSISRGIDQSTQSLYFVYTFADLTSLTEILAENNVLVQKKALRLFIQMLQGLTNIHSAGIVHGRVHPSNIFLDGEVVKYVGFGLDQAQLVYEMHQEVRDYLAPEQVQGQAATPKSDLFASGAILFRCITGKPPPPLTSEALTAPESGYMLHNEILVSDQIPISLKPIIIKITALDIIERYQSAYDVLNALSAEKLDMLPDAHE